MKAVIYINGKAKFQLTLYKKYTIRDIKSMLSKSLENLNSYSIRFFINKNSELEVFNNNEHDNLKLDSFWKQLLEPKFYIQETKETQKEIQKEIQKEETKDGNTKDFLTNIKDVDRLILDELSDKEFLQMCSLNKTYAERVCSDDYFRMRTEKRFPETIAYKDSVDSVNPEEMRTRRVRTWKNHYLNIVKYIDLLLREEKYIYRAEDKSPELLFLSRQLSPTYGYSKDDSLIIASEKGLFPLVKYLVETGADITANNNEAVRWASARGYLPVVKYLVEHGANINARNNQALIEAVQRGNFQIIKYLVENGANITDQNNLAVIQASIYGELEVVKYLVEHGADITAQDNRPLMRASEKGYLPIVKYLLENGADITAQNNSALRLAMETENSELEKYLLEHGAAINNIYI